MDSAGQFIITNESEFFSTTFTCKFIFLAKKIWILEHVFNNYCNIMILACAPPKTSLIPKVNIGSDLDAYVTVWNTVHWQGQITL